MAAAGSTRQHAGGSSRRPESSAACPSCGSTFRPHTWVRVKVMMGMRVKEGSAARPSCGSTSRPHTIQLCAARRAVLTQFNFT